MGSLTFVEACCIMVFFIATILNAYIIAEDWRDQYNKFETFDFDGKKIMLASDEASFKQALLPEKIENSFRIYWGVYAGFVGDKAVYIILRIAFCINVVNFALMLSSMFKFFPSACYFIIPVASFINFLLVLSCIIIVAVYKNTMYFPKNTLKLESNPVLAALYHVDGDDIIGPVPYIISFSWGFYFAIILHIFIFLLIGLTACVICDDVEEEKKNRKKSVPE